MLMKNLMLGRIFPVQILFYLFWNTAAASSLVWGLRHFNMWLTNRPTYQTCKLNSDVCNAAILCESSVQNIQCSLSLTSHWSSPLGQQQRKVNRDLKTAVMWLLGILLPRGQIRAAEWWETSSQPLLPVMWGRARSFNQPVPSTAWAMSDKNG